MRCVVRAGTRRRRVGWCAVTLLALGLPFANGTAQGTGRTPTFRVERPVFAGASGANRLEVDVPLLVGGRPFSVVQPGEVARAASGLGDLRFYDAGGREVPYLLVSPPATEPRWLPAQVLPIPARDSLSGFQADLGTVQSVDRIRINGLPAPFLKRVQLEGSGDATRWTQLVREGTLFDLPDEKLRQTELAFRRGEYRYLRIVWDDSSSGRLPLPTSAQARHAGPNAPPAPLAAALRVERRPSEPGKSRYRIRLPGARLPVVALELEVRGGNVLREARVTETRLAQREMRPALLGQATLRRSVRGNAAAANLRIPLAPPSEAELELVVDDANNPPLDLAGITAVFATLPFIYFESERGEPLVARYGNSRLAAPVYDLEAVRDSAHTIVMASARWGEPRELVPIAVGPAAVALHRTGAAIDANSFRWRRAIPRGVAGLTALTLDVAVLAHSRISDVRIARPDGRQVPYIVEQLEEPLRIDLPALATAPAPSQEVMQASSAPDGPGVRTYYGLRLPHDTLPASRLVLTTGARVFRRHLRVEVVRPPSLNDGRRGPWREVVASSGWQHADETTAAAPLTFDLPPLRSAEAYLVVDEGDNSRLPLERPTLLLPSYRLRFYRENADTALSLLYGRAGLAAPTYDIELLAPELVGAAAIEVAPGPESPGAAAAAGRIPRAVFWAVLGLAVLVMIGLIARLLKNGPIIERPANGSAAPPAA